MDPQALKLGTKNNKKKVGAESNILVAYLGGSCGFSFIRNAQGPFWNEKISVGYGKM